MNEVLQPQWTHRFRFAEIYWMKSIQIRDKLKIIFFDSNENKILDTSTDIKLLYSFYHASINESVAFSWNEIIIYLSFIKRFELLGEDG
jgi:hypothetical protein